MPGDLHILTQRLPVSFRTVSSKKGTKQEFLEYQRWLPQEGAPRDSVIVDIDKEMLRSLIKDVRVEVDRMIDLAISGKSRGSEGVESAAEALAQQVLPPRGLAEVVAQGMHPQFHTIADAAGQIPWEVLEEHYYCCPNGHRLVPDPQAAKEALLHCRIDKLEMMPSSSRLALGRHVTHLVAREDIPRAEGNRFLFIADPTGQLCAPENDPEGVCAQHLTALRNLIKGLGYDLLYFSEGNATRAAVRDALRNPDVVGVYYFGHGFFPPGKNQGRLVLSDGDLFAREIEAAGPGASFVFLNACEGAATGEKEVFEAKKRVRSVAEAFARGGGRVVIATLWPVLSVQAALTAVEFFQHLDSRKNAATGEALMYARECSFRRYQDKKPDISWMSYRFFGDPNQLLPAFHLKPEPPTKVAVSGVAALARCRVFNAKSQLDRAPFAFDIDEALLSAAGRRNAQGRAQATVADFLAGLVGKGDLTRSVLRDLSIHPDQVCREILRTRDDGRSAAKMPVDPGDLPRATPVPLDEFDEEGVRRQVASTLIADRRELTDELAAALERADARAQQAGAVNADQRICERDVLEELLAMDAWAALGQCGLPPAARMKDRLAAILAAGEVDGNGVIDLSCLDADARRVVEMAHAHAQQRGIFPISHRLMLAALVVDENGCGAHACRKANIDPDELFALMIALLENPSQDTDQRESDSSRLPRRTFGLSLEAADRIIRPVIQEARRMAGSGHLVSEKHLFLAFCAKANPGFKMAMATPPFPVDLDQLAAIVQGGEDRLTLAELLGRLDGSATGIVRTVHDLAQRRGDFPISNRLVLAAFLSAPGEHAARLLSLPTQSAKALSESLIGIAGTGTRRDFELSEEACARIVRPMLERSVKLAGADATVTEQVLFQAYCQVAASEFKTALKAQLRLDLDSCGRCSDALPARPVSDAQPRPTPTQGSGSGGLPAGDDSAAPRLDDFDDDAWRVVQEAREIARKSGWPEVRTPHVAAALLVDRQGPVVAALREQRIDPELARQMVLSFVPQRAGGGQEPTFGDRVRNMLQAAVRRARGLQRAKATQDDLYAALVDDAQGPLMQVLQALRQGAATAPWGAGLIGGGTSVLASLGVDLTDKARRGELPEIVGRDDQIDRAMQTFLLSENANPLLVGDAGVGKTAIVEGLAQRIVEGRCPRILRDKRIIELSADGLVANTRLRGEFEQRVRDVLEEARQGEVLLFIDEIHTIVGAGVAEGGGPDAANMLKSALARGEIRLIGATTPAEYRRTIARDKALSRRFQVQVLSPPSREATIGILSARQSKFEPHHHVKITEEAKIAAVDLSGRYITDRQWPAKARDVLERACVAARVEAEEAKQEEPAVVQAAHVARVVADLTGIPVERVSAADMSALATLESRLNDRVVGQQDAVQTVARAIRLGRQGLTRQKKPWGVFLFVGPPGVGKTELAKVLAEEVYGGSDGLIRFDMGDFTEPHSTARLIGAPPGYVGFDQGAPLVERLRNHPYSLLLFDEIEHAHDNVLAVLLRLFSEGTIADAEGNVADATNSIVIMTCNILGSQRERHLGFDSEAASAPAQYTQTELRGLLGRTLPAKLIDRLDAVVTFNSLTAEGFRILAGRRVAEIIDQASARHAVSVEVSGDVVSWLAETGMQRYPNARDVLRFVEDNLGSAMVVALSDASLGPNPRLRIDVRADRSGLDCRVVLPETPADGMPRASA